MPTSNIKPPTKVCTKPCTNSNVGSMLKIVDWENGMLTVLRTYILLGGGVPCISLLPDYLKDNTWYGARTLDLLHTRWRYKRPSLNHKFLSQENHK
uniref:Uncharacterized protein n=1 Tax=Romanomermis culicivorax TaxID=13658 RepID=A0A915JF75_ROMCU